tara:strand:- start:186 stop:383 length:198 start_codon:yes stop_codon:yes gene_type:complete
MDELPSPAASPEELGFHLGLHRGWRSAVVAWPGELALRLAEQGLQRTELGLQRTELGLQRTALGL